MSGQSTVWFLDEGKCFLEPLYQLVALPTEIYNFQQHPFLIGGIEMDSWLIFSEKSCIWFEGYFYSGESVQLLKLISQLIVWSQISRILENWRNDQREKQEN